LFTRISFKCSCQSLLNSSTIDYKVLGETGSFATLLVDTLAVVRYDGRRQRKSNKSLGFHTKGSLPHTFLQIFTERCCCSNWVAFEILFQNPGKPKQYAWGPLKSFLSKTTTTLMEVELNWVWRKNATQCRDRLYWILQAWYQRMNDRKQWWKVLRCLPL